MRRLSTVLSSLRVLGVVSASFLALATSAHAQAEVSFKDPDKFSDLGETHWDRQNAMKQLEEHIKRQADRELAGKQLKIEFTDIDLAGELEPRVAANRIRVLRTVTIPRLEFTYTLSENGKVLEQGKATINDLNYQNSTNRYFDSEPFRYEKKLLDDWMAKELLHKDRLARTGP
ncbi:DUF3016 domain-containing protein [Roseateles depolymerans]|uniref:Uncharacterized protein n=1 Tax=Roseateles depolymerans TaxID=76731 RepID=A0A0U3MDS1_9BURK|nr:DUF3016 domain-containing protein [Roseateles depolymerans]ALV06457.1 hypothetical protein RD2015_1981 [Roseateles depolymerans]REG19432.1 DUF3016 family protein [Roseateles depolymerans]